MGLPLEPRKSTRGELYFLLDKPMSYLHSLHLFTMSDNSLRIPDSIDIQRLSAMQFVAKMKESADKYGIGFVGGFIASNGEKFMMSNMSDEDTQMFLPDDLK